MKPAMEWPLPWRSPFRIHCTPDGACHDGKVKRAVQLSGGVLDGGRADQVWQAVGPPSTTAGQAPARLAPPETDQERGADEDKHPDRGMLRRLPHPPAIMGEN